jgi:lysophospholipase L1-like esterase
MTRTTLERARAMAVTVAIAGLTACAPDVEIVRPGQPIGNALFRSYVALGNSLTAGFQSSGINATTQAEAYPVVLADAVGTPFRVPALALPGCPPPIVDFLTGERVGGAMPATCAFRDPSSVTSAINNVAVFGATTLDPTSRSTSSSNPTTMLILGGKTQVERALEADPSFVSIWIGNNDALDAATTGLTTPTAGISRGITSQQDFETSYGAMLNQLTTGADLEGGLLIGVLDATQAPLLFPAAVLVTDPQFKAAFDQFAGTPTALLPSCTAGTTSLISFAIVQRIRDGTHPPVIGCEPEPAPLAPVGNIFVVDATERQVIAMAIAGFNAYIAAQADALGLAFLDPNPVLASLRQGGQIPPVPNLASATAPYGDYVSLDGVHPSAKGQAAIANAVIDVINQEYGISIPDVPIP